MIYYNVVISDSDIYNLKNALLSCLANKIKNAG